jgi:hypothetical protein
MDESEPEVILDLRERVGPDVDFMPDVDEVIEYLRTTGGTLRDRIMKHVAADLLSELPRTVVDAHLHEVS